MERLKSPFGEREWNKKLKTQRCVLGYSISSILWGVRSMFLLKTNLSIRRSYGGVASLCGKIEISRIYVWLAVNREKNQIVEFKVTWSKGLEVYQALAKGLRQKYKIQIACSDYFSVYEKDLVSKIHVQTKAETSLVECFNSLIATKSCAFSSQNKTLR